MRIAVVLLLVTFWVRGEDLLQELSRRSATEGLAIVHWNGIPVSVLTFDGASQATWSAPFLLPQTVSKPPYLSSAWFGPNGDSVAWNHHELSHSLSCPNPTIIESPNTAPWQLPGSVGRADALGVSADSSHVAFDGIYLPPGTNSRRMNGLFYADSKTNQVTRISESCGTTSISRSPNGNAFVYDCRDRVLIYDVRGAKSKDIGAGSTPSWSPDGRWIAFRLHGRAAAIDLTTMKPKPLMGGRTIRWGIHWSPDSRYLMASQRVGIFEEIMHWSLEVMSDAPSKIVIERLADGAISDRLWFPIYGEDDRGYYWITNYQAFLQKAMQPAVVKPCP